MIIYTRKRKTPRAWSYPLDRELLLNHGISLKGLPHAEVTRRANKLRKLLKQAS